MAKIVVKRGTSQEKIRTGVSDKLGGDAPISERRDGSIVVSLNSDQKRRYDQMTPEQRERVLGGKTSEILEG